MPAVVVDFYQPHDLDFYECLIATGGVSGIARYLTPNPDDVRKITPREVGFAHQVGLSVHLFFEGNPTYAGYFTFAQGAEDCRQAVDRLRELGAPQGTVVYFAVDTNLDPVLCDLYFNGVESMVTPQVTPGIYGYQRMCEYARRNYPKVGQHLAQTYGTKTVALDLWQHEQVDICGVAVDLNECTVEGWKSDMTPEEAKAIAVQAIADAGLDPNTIEIIKRSLDHHRHTPATGLTSEPITLPWPITPPVEGAVLNSASADFRQLFWMYPDGKLHTWIDGKEVTS